MTLDIGNLHADYFLRLREGEGEPRACWLKGRLRDKFRDDWMLVSIEPPLIGQSYGLGNADLYFLLLATRHQGQTLFPVSAWPAHVFVMRILDGAVVELDEFDNSQTEMIEWGVLHKSYEDAIRDI